MALLYDVDQSEIPRIYLNRNKYISIRGNTKTRKTLSKGKHEQLEISLVIYIKLLRNENFLITKYIILESAKKIACDLEIDNFSASNGWFNRFKTRNEIGSFAESGTEQS